MAVIIEEKKAQEEDAKLQEELKKEMTKRVKTKKVAYFKSYTKTLGFVLRAPEIVFGNDGTRNVKKKGINVKFTNYTYRPKNEEEKKLLLALAEKKPNFIKYISSAQQEKEEELKKEIEKKRKELDEKYSKIETVEKKQAVQGFKQA